MIEVRIPADVQEYKSKLIFGLSLRQFLSIAGAMALAIPIAIFGKKFGLSEDSVVWAIILITVPFACYGFLKIKDMKFEEYFKHWLYNNVFGTRKRYYETGDIDLLQELQIKKIEETLTGDDESGE